MTDARACDIGCGAPAATVFSADRGTLAALGLEAPAALDRIALHVCAGCYLKAMGLVLEAAHLPKAVPLPVDYWCERCARVIPTAEVRFVGRQGVTPVHQSADAPAYQQGVMHGLKLRVRKGQPEGGPGGPVVAAR